MDKRALLIGINYTGTPFQLEGCINDVLAMKQVLEEHYQYRENNVLILTDSTEYRPTKGNILAAFRWLLSGASANLFAGDKQYDGHVEMGTIFYVHFSGHGGQVIDHNNDETDGKDEVIYPIDFATAGSLSDDEIRRSLVSNIAIGNHLVSTIDCCNSGTIFDLRWIYSVQGETFELKKDGEYDPTPGDVLVLSGSRDDQLARETNNGGALTRTLIEILTKSNYKITCDELLRMLREGVLSKGIDNQTPYLSAGRWTSIDRPYRL